MANIKLENLDISGLDLFSDSESFIVELIDEGEEVIGGIGTNTILPTRTKNPCGNVTRTAPSLNCGSWDLF